MAKMAKATCSQCGEQFSINMGELTKNEAVANLKKWDSFECPGHHVEFGSPLNYWNIDWDSVEEEEPITEEQWLTNLKSKYKHVYSAQEFNNRFTDVQFMYGVVSAKNKLTDEKMVLDFTNSPEGKRYYYA